MQELRNLWNEVKTFVHQNKDDLMKWLLISLGATVAINLLLMMLPVLPFAALLFLPLAGWKYAQWKRHS